MDRCATEKCDRQCYTNINPGYRRNGYRAWICQTSSEAGPTGGFVSHIDNPGSNRDLYAEYGYGPCYICGCNYIRYGWVLFLAYRARLRQYKYSKNGRIGS